MGAVREKLLKGLSWSWQIQKRRRHPTDPFFEDGDLVCCLAGKQIPFAEQEDFFCHRLPEFVCSIARCSKSFDNILSYEAHYNSNHRNSCGSCGRSFPSNRLLELHILETHDSMFEVLSTKQNMFQCLVEECYEKFPSPLLRKDHLVKVHHYPASFRFHREKKAHSRCMQPAKDPENGVEPMESESVCHPGFARAPQLTTQPGSQDRQPRRVFSHNVPKSITFGQGVSRGFHRRGRGRVRGSHAKASHWHQKAGEVMEMDTTVDIEAVNMGDLASALNT
ncbi:zinc finger protein 511-like isoform X2 [Liolophura sinensis]|uniref:zinc finger protein 511-like isoform X2 n=1 Tax=Liolophura sinensis TaxID=3198878 RepID=UPI0031589079